ncbi:MAG: VTT domain-containing protein [Candidatus Bathyarchaeia archaeon]|jgi:membrane protein DedA with SNARE-associated domain
MAFIIEFIITFLFAFGLNLIPFFGPSNLLIASTAAIGMANADATALVTIGFLIALAAALAKGIHYMITFFVSGHLSEKSRQRLDTEAVKVKRWAFLLLYLAAATPIPDEPVVIPLGLMKYSPAKFFLSYFLGKITITIAGAFLGSWVEANFASWLSPEAMIAISIALTVIITVILFKVDVGKQIDKILKRLKPYKKATSD